MGGRGLRLVYSVGEAAELLGVGRSTAYELVARGELATVRLGSRVVVTRPTLTALLGVEPPLPAELDVMRAALGDPALGDPPLADPPLADSPLADSVLPDPASTPDLEAEAEREAPPRARRRRPGAEAAQRRLFSA